MSLRFDFSGRVVLVTGAAGGIGASVARAFAEGGAVVHGLDVSAVDVAGCASHHCDVSDGDQVAATVERISASAGRIDCLINNAGILRDRILWRSSLEDWNAVLGVHLTGTYLMTRAVVPLMRERNYGRIVNVTSYTGLRGNIGQTAYAAAKAGIIGFTKTAAKELAGFGVTVNAVSPNAETDMVNSISADKYEELRRQIPAGRFASSDEMFPAFGFLASEQAGYVTGIVLPIDGGLSM